MRRTTARPLLPGPGLPSDRLSPAPRPSDQAGVTAPSSRAPGMQGAHYLGTSDEDGR